nr:hypothetical protein [Ponticaulis koreensis]
MTADATLDFELTVSDGEFSDTSAISITATNIVRAPLVTSVNVNFGTPIDLEFDQIFPDLMTVQFFGAQTAASGIRTKNDGTLEYFMIDVEANNGFDTETTVDLPNATPGQLAIPAFMTGPFPGFGAAIEKVLVFPQDSLGFVMEYDGNVPAGQTIKGTLTLNDICYASADLLDGLSGTTDLFLASDTNGMRYLPRTVNGGVSTYGQAVTITPDGNFCQGSSRVYFRNEPAPEHRMAIDVSVPSIRTFFHSAGSYTESDETPITLAQGQEIVWTQYVPGSLISSGGGSSDNYIAYIATDGEHTGNHTLYLYGQTTPDVNETFALVDSLDLGVGVPERLYFRDFDGDRQWEIYIFYENVPYIGVVELEGFDRNVQLSVQGFIETGFDADDILAIADLAGSISYYLEYSAIDQIVPFTVTAAP